MQHLQKHYLSVRCHQYNSNTADDTCSYMRTEKEITLKQKLKKTRKIRPTKIRWLSNVMCPFRLDRFDGFTPTQFLNFWTIPVLRDISPRAHKIITSIKWKRESKKIIAIHQRWIPSKCKIKNLFGYKFSTGWGASQPPSKHPSNFLHSLDFEHPESIVTVLDWPKSLKACLSHVGAKKTRKIIRQVAPPSPVFTEQFYRAWNYSVTKALQHKDKQSSQKRQAIVMCPFQLDGAEWLTT